MIVPNSGDKSAQNSKRGNARIITVVVAAIVVCVGVVTALLAKSKQDLEHKREMEAAVNTNKFYSGISVQGVDVSGMTMEEALKAVKEQEASAVGTYRIVITCGDKQWELTQTDMSFLFDTQDVLNKAYAIGRSGDLETRYKIVTELKTKPQKFSLTATLDEDALKAKIMEIAAEIEKPAAEPTVTAFSVSSGFQFQDGKAGVSVDKDSLWNDVKAVVEGERVGNVTMKTTSVPFKTSLSSLKNHMKKLGTFSTVSVNNANGTYNMKKALLLANGTKIDAGATFSFFKTVGPCDKANGFLIAGAIENGRHIDSYGGGICQASTTIYGAALRSGMKIVERHNHSIPSAYCEIGQDATVSYPYTDLKLMNTTAYPMFLVTSASGRKLTATFYGYQPDDYDSIEIVSRIDKTYPAPTEPKYIEDSSLAANVVKLEQKAKTGYLASARRLYLKNGKTVKTEYLNSSTYPAMPAYYAYGPGTSRDKLTGKPTTPEKTPTSPSTDTPTTPQTNKPSPETNPGTSADNAGNADGSNNANDQNTAA
jgi:vancomycin resistance protein YoaR